MARIHRPPPAAQRARRVAALPPRRAPAAACRAQLQQRASAGLALALLSLLAMVLIGNLQRPPSYAVALPSRLSRWPRLLGDVGREAAHRRPRVVGAVLGVIGLLFSGFALLGFLIFGAQLNQYANCGRARRTRRRQQACQNQLDNSITSRIGALGG